MTAMMISKELRDGAFWFSVVMLFAYVLGLALPPG
jgi:hypothetical protein